MSMCALTYGSKIFKIFQISQSPPDPQPPGRFTQRPLLLENTIQPFLNIPLYSQLQQPPQSSAFLKVWKSDLLWIGLGSFWRKPWASNNTQSRYPLALILQRTFCRLSFTLVKLNSARVAFSLRCGEQRNCISKIIRSSRQANTGIFRYQTDFSGGNYSMHCHGIDFAKRQSNSKFRRQNIQPLSSRNV